MTKVRPVSLTQRLASLFALSSGAIVLVAGTLIFFASNAHFIEQDAHDLHERTQIVVNQLRLSPRPEELTAALDRTLISHHDLAAELRSPQGQLRYARQAEIFAGTNLPQENTGSHPEALQQIKVDGKLWRATQTALPETGDELRLAVGIDHHQAFLDALLHWLVIGGFGIVALSYGLGHVLARQGLAPLQKISANATLISANRLSARIDETAIPAELLPMVRELNAMLARLDEAFRRLNDFSSDIAHELRTPVSNLVTQTEVALTQARSSEEYRDILGSNLEEFGRLGRMIGDMLFLARADHGLILPALTTVSLDHEVDALIAFFQVVADERDLMLYRDGSAQVQGDALMLRRAVANLLANAIQHATAGSSIRVGLFMSPDRVRIVVRNFGPGIPAEHLPRIFDRFYRGDAARQQLGDHSGLGLAIVKSILEAHGGSVSASSDATETCFELILPTP